MRRTLRSLAFDQIRAEHNLYSVRWIRSGMPRDWCRSILWVAFRVFGF